MEKFILVGAKTCINCSMVKKILDTKGEPYTYIDIGDYKGELSTEGKDVVEKYQLKKTPDGMFVIPFLIRVADGKVRNGPGAISFAQKG